jgi:hypothetical protein
MFRFALKKLKGQNIIRYSGVGKRPINQELAEQMKIRRLLEF